MYIHIKEPNPKQIQDAANCQFISKLHQKSLVQLKAGILARANLRNTCPPVSKMLCTIEYGTIFHMTILMLLNELNLNYIHLLSPSIF